MIVENWYVALDADGWVVQWKSVFEESEGPNPLPLGQHNYLHDSSDLRQQLPPTPTSRLRKTEEGFVWVETAGLEGLRQAKRNEITAAKLAANRSFFMFNGHRIQADEGSMLEIQSTNSYVTLTGQMPAGWPGAWKTLDNGYAVITDVAAWTNFIGALVTTGLNNFAKSEQLKNALAAATTAEQIEAITWESA